MIANYGQKYKPCAILSYMPKKKNKIKYIQDAKIKCACGNVFKVGATRENMEVEICSNCHPFYTGKGKILDTAGRVERFKKIIKKSQNVKRGS